MDVHAASGLAGEAGLTLAWRVLHALTMDDTIFVHYWKDGQFVAGQDGDSLGGLIPPVAWQPGLCASHLGVPVLMLVIFLKYLPDVSSWAIYKYPYGPPLSSYQGYWDILNQDPTITARFGGNYTVHYVAKAIERVAVTPWIIGQSNDFA